jgi:hypothetical protein
MNLLIFGRGTGKTEGPGAMFCLDNILKMPRSRGAIICRSYINGLEVIVPALIAGWERLGYREGEHFWCYKWPPEEFGIVKPYGKVPQKPNHVISWYNGSIISLVSMDRPATSNGLSVDWLYLDEARLHNYQKIKELLPILRGNGEWFGHLANHGSMLFTTDRPRSTKEKWVLNFAKQMNKEVIDGILMIQAKIVELQKVSKKASIDERKKLDAEISKYKNDVNELAKGSVYVGYASTLENIHTLGINFIKNLKRSLTKLDYQMQVLNQDIFKVEGGFYGAVPFDSVTYEALNYVYIDSVKGKRDSKFDCRMDKDLVYDLPIHIGCDYGDSINCIVAGQAHKTKVNVVKSLYVLHPLLIQDVVKDFCDYYKPYQENGRNTIIYHYDHTAVGGFGNTRNKYFEDVVNTLQENGFIVIKHYIRKQPTYVYRYDFWAKIYNTSKRFFIPFYINKNNNEKLIISCEQAGTKTMRNGFEKDKSLEKDKLADQSEATHLSDAFDTLAVGIYKYTTKKKGYTI